MKILFVNQFYTPDVAATAQQMSDLAEHLVGHGHDVQVLCSRGQYDDGSGRAVPKREVIEGVNVRRVKAPSFGKKSTLGRVMDYFGFHVLAGLWVMLFGWRYDVVVTLTTPPLIGIYGTFVKWLSFGKTKHVCWSMDLHPDCEFELGVCSRKNPFWRFLDFLNGMHFRQAHKTVALGECMKKRLVDKHVEAEKVEVIGVWNRADQVKVLGFGESVLLETHGLKDKFVVMYSGNAGLIHTFDVVCEGMKRLKDDERIVFLFVGGGKRLDEIERFANEHGLENFMRLPYFPREQLNDSLGMGDVHLVTMREGMQGVAVPCKLYGIMAAGRPAIFVGPEDADTALQIKAAEGGEVIGVEDVDGFVGVVKKMVEDREMVRQKGEAGRAYFMGHHEKNVCCEAWRALLEGVVKG